MDDGEIERLASNINFLREWRYFNYEPRVIRFASEAGCSSGTEAQNEITLSQFSAVEVPKCKTEAEQGPSSQLSAQSRKDYILYAGGLVWALDWCPRAEQGIDSDTNCEFIAVAAHPPDSTYHKIGAPLSGRGMVQIWCVQNYITNEDLQIPLRSTKQNYKKTVTKKVDNNKPVRPRGRPRKNSIIETPAADPESQFMQAPVQLSEDPLVTLHAGKDSQSISASQNMLPLVQPPEDALNTPHAEQFSGSISASQSLLAPVHDNMQSEKNAIEKENITYKRRKRKTGGSTMDEASVDSLDSQFIPPLAVQLPDTTNVFPVDKMPQNTPVHMKVNRKKQKAINNDNTSVYKTAVPESERPSLQPLAMMYPESMINYSHTGGDLLSSSSSDLEKRRKIPPKQVLESDLDFTIATFKSKSRNKSMFLKDHRFDNNGNSVLSKCGGSSLTRLEENVLKNNGTTPQGHFVGSSLTDVSSGVCHDNQSNILPRAVLCLGHDGKVAWDVKWRPTGGESCNMYRMGYLAVILGNGSIEVWEVPSLQVVSRIYATRRGKDTDPRFAKLKPVFKCSKLNHGDRLSMPLTVEWSASPPHDLLLAGCHDGVVAVWKFSTVKQYEDARPLLCFSAETGPIRAIRWAPFDGDAESSNIIVTAGHGGLKFWDLRDPYRPLWDANPSQRFIYGLDWLPDPRCVLVSYDDGNIRMLSMLRSAYDVPVTGEPFSGTQQQGLHSYSCSSSAIWSIHVSRQTGIAAYCCADGAVLYFQVTQRAVEKDPFRNRAPHFLCGSLASEGSAVSLNTELPSSPHRMKKSATEWANTPRSARTVVSGSNQGKRVKKGADKSTNHGEEVLALCYDDDAEGVEANEAQKSTKTGNAKTNKSTTATYQGSLPPGGEGVMNSSEKPDTKQKAWGEVETIPSKTQAMYRVRWNMNKGSERWLCYGGAAGIVRCQEIVIPEFDKKLLKR